MNFVFWSMQSKGNLIHSRLVNHQRAFESDETVEKLTFLSVLPAVHSCWKHSITVFLYSNQRLNQMSKLQKEERSNKIKGTSWLLDDSQAQGKEKANDLERKRKIEENIKSQNKKWKKITNNRFKGYNKKIQQLVEGSFKQQNNTFNQFKFESLRHTDSLLNQRHSQSSSSLFLAKRRSYQGQIFQMRRKEREILNQITKMNKLKDITSICEQKKSFYDGCVDKYFEDYRTDINRTISTIGNKCQKRHSKNSICFR